MTPVELDDARRAKAAEVGGILIGLADGNFRGYSALYDRVARAWAADDEALAWIAVLDLNAGLIPVTVFAAVQDLVLRDPDLALARLYAGEPGDPWPPFRALLEARLDEVLHLASTRSIQTNEVGRSTVLVPALTWVASRFAARPLALVEIGPSAGLNLLVDRYHVSYDDGRSTGDPHSPVQLSCRLVGGGRPPLPGHDGLRIARREGIDLAPIDVREDEATRWLEACIWPDVPERHERLRAALAIARDDPPTLWCGDAVDLLGRRLDAIDGDAVPVVFSTWALAYLSAEDRLAVHELVAERGAARDVALLNAEYPHVIPWIPLPDRRPAVPEGVDATLVGATVWSDGVQADVALGWMHAHGQWLDWMADGRTDELPNESDGVVA